MDSMARAAYIISQSACVSARIAAMQEQCAADRAAGRPVSYQPHDFEAVPDQCGLGHNTVISYLQGY
jgi:hypothetical protein